MVERHNRVTQITQRVAEFSKANQLFEKGDKIIVGYSGGIDSSVLLTVLLKLADELEISPIACYFNHGLRGQESSNEARFVKNFADEHSLPFYFGNGTIKDTAKVLNISTQEAARKERYVFFAECKQKFNAKIIATAHHKDDQIESTLMAFLKGYSLTAQKGIPVKRETIIRPLLCLTRSEIEQFAVDANVTFFEDSSNKKTDYFRNSIRHEILPFLREKFDFNIDKTILKQTERFAEIDKMLSCMKNEAIEKIINRKSNSKIILDINQLKNYFNVLRRMVISEAVHALSDCSYNEKKDAIGKVLSIINGTIESKSMYICSDLYIDLRNETAEITKKDTHKMDARLEYGSSYVNNELGFEISLQEINLESTSSYKKHHDAVDLHHKEVIDRELLKGECRVRLWREGDSFMPLGMDRQKKLADFFNDNNIPPTEKTKIPLITDDEKILYVCGYRIDDRVKITGKSKKLLEIRYSKKFN